jgi:hypothetical protein
MLLEDREQERERQQAQQPQGLIAPPVGPIRREPTAGAAANVLETFSWIDDPST